jgi:lysophospholipase L1-like esterase
VIITAVFSLKAMSHRRFVALGDSTTEGLMDLYPDGGFRGWADRLALRLAELEPDLLYANLAVRGKLARQVRADQLAPALALRPDLLSVLAGLNDMLRSNCDVAAVAGEIEAIVVAARAVGADVLTFTLPDPVQVNPLARRAAVRLARLNAAVRELSARHGALVVDLEAHPVASDPRLWDLDRLHANPDGHRRIAAAAAHALGLPDADEAWSAAFADPFARRSAASHVVWARRYFVPWLIRRLRGRSSGDGRVAKRPQLEPLGGAQRDIAPQP